MSNEQTRPPRTIGITIAILLSSVTYTLLPALLVIFTLLLKARLRSTDVTVGTGGQSLVGGRVGFVSVTNIELFLWATAAVAFLVVAALAWRGKSPAMRFVFVGAALVMPLCYAGLWYYRTYQDTRAVQETGALLPASSFPSFCSVTILLPVFVSVYVVWYMNRGPARAFYRGYYLHPDQEQRVEIK